MAGVMTITLLVQVPMAMEEPILYGTVGVQLVLIVLWLITYRHNEIRLTQAGLYLRLGFASRNVSWDQVVGLSTTGPSELVVIVDEGRGPVEAVPKMVAHLSFSFFWLGTPRESWLTTPEHIPQRFPSFIGEVIHAWARLNRC